jgi:APA family basic amino acid/polyamine antiporter
MLFFAFAGYARLATLGGEVVAPERTIPRAISWALGIALVVYATVGVSVLAATGAAAVAASEAPLMNAVATGRFAELAPLVRAGAAVATLGALLSLIAGVGRTVFAMASRRDLPAIFAAVHPRYGVPYRAELAVGGVITLTLAVADVRSAIGFSSFAVLTYYGITNAAAWTLEPTPHRWQRILAGLGLLGCATLALTLPMASIAAGVTHAAAGAPTRRSKKSKTPSATVRRPCDARGFDATRNRPARRR